MICSHFGEVLEWLKRHAWKACSRRNRLAGSNPVLSAINIDYQCLADFSHAKTHDERGLRAIFVYYQRPLYPQKSQNRE